MQPDELLPLKIMSILQQKTDESHRLTQASLADLLRQQYGSAVPARTLRRVLAAMAAFDDDIAFDEHARTGVNTIRTNFFLQHPLSDGELRVLIDSVAFLPSLPARCAAALPDWKNPGPGQQLSPGPPAPDHTRLPGRKQAALSERGASG